MRRGITAALVVVGLFAVAVGTGTHARGEPDPLVADLAGRGAWPDHHHFPIAKFGTTQTLFGKIANVGLNGSVNAKVRFTILNETGVVVDEVDSSAALIPVGGDAEVNASRAVDLGKFSVTAECLFDSDNDGTFDGVGASMKTFSFAVVP